MTEPLILTLTLDESTQAFLDRERERHFPPALNFLRAHVTMFHHLPGDRLEGITADLEAACAAQGVLPVTVTGVRSLGRGVAYVLHSPGAERLRAGLAARWADCLTAQDRQSWRPHVTVQNKVAPEQARALHARLSAGWTDLACHATGVALWRYLGGPWARETSMPFG